MVVVVVTTGDGHSKWRQLFEAVQSFLQKTVIRERKRERERSFSCLFKNDFFTAKY